jgi:hypothetical protein
MCMYSVEHVQRAPVLSGKRRSTEYMHLELLNTHNFWKGIPQHQVLQQMQAGSEMLYLLPFPRNNEQLSLRDPWVGARGGGGGGG